MMRIRETMERITKRKKHESDSKGGHKTKGKLQKLKKLKDGLNIFSKLKRGKKKPADVQTAQFEELEVEEKEEGGFQRIEITVQKPKEDDVPETEHTVEADFHRDFNTSGEKEPEFLLRSKSDEVLNSERLSKASLVPCVSSRISVISQKSMSNASIISVRKTIPNRTVWTQTEVNTVDVDIETGASIENMEQNASDPSLSRSHDQMSFGSAEFGVDDVFLREPVVNAKLAAIRDRITFRLRYPCLHHCDPEVCVELLRYPKLPFLISLNRKLSVEDSDFNELFIAFRGLEYLLFLMEEIANAGIEDLYDVMKMLLVSECTTSLVNSTSGRDFIINHGEHIVSLARGK